MQNIWIILGAILVAGVLMLVLGLLLKTTKSERQISGPSTAVLNIIEAPTITPIPLSQTATPSITQPSDIPPPPLAGDLSIGDNVQISGTGGDGLRLRSSPGLEGEVLFLGYEGEVFQISDGPEDADGYVWWYLTAPYDEKVQGWAVSNYLTVLQNP